jgi:hypothetical protein
MFRLGVRGSGLGFRVSGLGIVAFVLCWFFTVVFACISLVFAYCVGGGKGEGESPPTPPKDQS